MTASSSMSQAVDSGAANNNTGRLRIRQRSHMAGGVGSTTAAANGGAGGMVTPPSLNDVEAQAIVQSTSASPGPSKSKRGRRKIFQSGHHHPNKYWHLLQEIVRDLPDLYRRTRAWMKHNPRLTWGIIIAIPFILRPSRLWKWRYAYFGWHNIAGGEFGQYIEKRGYKQRYREVMDKQQKILDSLGIVLPPGIPPDDHFRVLKLDTQAALKELLIRREKRAQTLARLEQLANSPQHICASQESIRDTEGEPPILESPQNATACQIPKVIFVPDGIIPGWTPPRPGISRQYQQLPFDQREMRQFIEDTRPGLVALFDGLLLGHFSGSPEAAMDLIYLWAMCALYHFGGSFVGDIKHSQSTPLQSLLWASHNPIVDKQEGGPLLLAVLGEQKERASQQIIQVLAATPRHPTLLCTLLNLESSTQSILDANRGADAAGSLVSHLFPELDPDHRGWSQGLLDVDQLEQLKTRPRTVDGDGDGHVCEHQVTALSSRPEFAVGQARDATAEYYVNQLDKQSKQLVPLQKAYVNVMEETMASRIPSLTEKVTLESQLQARGLLPGWSCMRCIKLPQYGQFQRCEDYCPSGYVELMCHTKEIPEKKNFAVEVTVKQPDNDDYRRGTAIPRIIHQTWFEDVTPDRYPQLARLQNSWKATGWKYRLYTDETARAYIVEHFPSRFVDAFDALIPGAFKADLFRYLVLMREGGVYADVDILLEINLDHFVTPSLSFFAPRDVVAEFAGEPFCLWNGLIGAAPGHPFIVRAVERLVGLILDRADVYDMERDLCRDKEEPVDVWKVWLQTLLLLSGPCALGVAVNEALGRSSLQGIDTGWMGLDELEFGGKKDHGDALIMVVDKHDIGGFKMSDPERSLIVASTDIGVVKQSREQSNPMEAERVRQEQRQPKEHAHYSETTKGIFVWGSSGIYADNMVSDERINFTVRYE